MMVPIPGKADGRLIKRVSHGLALGQVFNEILKGDPRPSADNSLPACLCNATGLLGIPLDKVS